MKVIVFLISFVITLPVYSQVEYRTNKLLRISELLCLDIPDSLMNEDSIYYKKYKGQPIVICIKDKRVDHIGLSLLTQEQRTLFKSPAMDFLERYFLELSIPLDTLWNTSKRMKIDKVKFTKGNLSFLSQLPNDMYSLEVRTSKGHDYNVQWSKEGRVYCEVEFPMHFDLISGQDKEECENRLLHEIERDTIIYINKDTILPDMLVRDSLEGYYVCQGVNHYVSGLNNNQYFVMDSTGSLKPYYEPLHFVETLSNLFSMPYFENDYDLDITFYKSGTNTESSQISLSKWTKYFVGHGFVVYFGILEVRYPFVDCLIILSNREMAFEHSLIIHFDLKTLYELKGIIIAELHSYRMTSKIKTLFKEFDI